MYKTEANHRSKREQPNVPALVEVVAERIEVEVTTWVDVRGGEGTTAVVVGKLEVALDVPAGVVSEPAPFDVGAVV